MSFGELDLSRHYNSDEQDVLNDFYRPLMKRAVRYDRAVGYFSSSTLKNCALELCGLLDNQGTIRFVIGCLISQEDIDALSGATEEDRERGAVLEELKRHLFTLRSEDVDSAGLLGRLVSADVVRIKFAVRRHGIYHEKFGVFRDGGGNRVAFIGSANETEAALRHGLNHESFSVYNSREPAIYDAYGEPLERRFDDLWNGRTRNTRIYDLDETSLALMRELASQSPAIDQGLAAALPSLAGRFVLRPYQEDAIRAWAQNQYRGILAMATGTGKTLTAIDAVKRFREKVKGGAVVITVPYQNLALQWIDALREQGIDHVAVFQAHSNWYETVKNYFLSAQSAQLSSMPCFVCVNDTFKDARFQELLELLKSSKQPHNFLIADECHHFNGPEHVKSLPEHFTFRLGLSATPYDQFAQHYLDAYFGKVVFEFPLSRAIREGFLTPYRYHVIPVELDDDEAEVYEQTTYKIVQIAGSDEGFTPEKLAKVQPLLLKRSRLVGGAKDKLAKLESHLRKTGRLPYSLFYCGDASVDEGGERQRQIELVSQLLHRLGWRTSRITAEESLKEREALLDSLRREVIDAVVSIKVLDEGIDIPACKTAFLLASQSSDRQGIQRRGRVLRKSEGKESADLIDFVVVGGVTKSKTMTSLAKKELRRAWRFAIDAQNSNEVCAELTAIGRELRIGEEEINGNEK